MGHNGARFAEVSGLVVTRGPALSTYLNSAGDDEAAETTGGVLLVHRKSQPSELTEREREDHGKIALGHWA